MENSHVAKIPEPVVSKIIGFLDIDSVKRCREVCRRLKQVVDEKVLIPGDTYGILGKMYGGSLESLLIKHIDINPPLQKKFSTLSNLIHKMNDLAALRPSKISHSILAKPSVEGIEMINSITDIEEIPFLVQYLKAFYPRSFMPFILSLLKKCHEQEPTEEFLAWMIEIGGVFDLLQFAIEEREKAAILMPKLAALDAYANFQWKEELHYIQDHPISPEDAREILQRKNVLYATKLSTDPQERMRLLIATFIYISAYPYTFQSLPLYLKREPFIAEAAFHYDPASLLQSGRLRLDPRRIQRVYNSFLQYPKEMYVRHGKVYDLDSDHFSFF